MEILGSNWIEREHENMGGMIRMDDMERLERIEDEKLEMGVVNEGELEE